MQPELTIQPVLHGRVFSRLRQFQSLPEDLKEQVASLEKHLMTVQNELFAKHHTLQLKSVRGVRYKPLLETVTEWVADQEPKPFGMNPSVDHVAAAPAPADNAASNSSCSEATQETADAAVPVAPTIPINPDFKADASVSSEEEAEAKRSAEEATKTAKLTHAKKLIDALVLKGFVTPNREDKSTVPMTTESFDFKDSELLVPLATVVTGLTIPTTTVWDLVDGAVFAELIKRRAGLLAPLTHGKDVYVLVNAKARSVTLFESDVAREPLVIYEAALTHVTFDKTHYDYGLKLWSETSEELLNMASISERDALIAALEAIGVKYEEEFPILDHHAKPANFTTSHTYTVEQVTDAASDAVPLDDSTETLKTRVPARVDPNDVAATETAAERPTAPAAETSEASPSGEDPNKQEPRELEPPVAVQTQAAEARPSPFLEANQPGSPGMPDESVYMSEPTPPKHDEPSEATTASNVVGAGDAAHKQEPEAGQRREKVIRFEEPLPESNAFGNGTTNHASANANANANAPMTPP